MKKLYFSLSVLLVALGLQAQNLQLHYDFGKDRKYVTSTVEMFKPDKWGSTFFFIDMNYDADNGKTISLAYWEIARGISLGKVRLQHILNTTEVSVSFIPIPVMAPTLLTTPGWPDSITISTIPTLHAELLFRLCTSTLKIKAMHPFS